MQLDTTTTLILSLVLCCIVPTIVLAVVAVLALRQGQKLLTPELGDLQIRFDRLRAQHPETAPDKFIAQIVHRQALRSGIIGALTSVGGVWVLPFGLAIDLYASARNQAATMHFLAWANGIRDEDRVLKIGEMLALRGLEDKINIPPEMLMNWQTRFANRVYGEIAVQILQKSFAKLIPGLGLIIGFAVNYISARLFATAAHTYYSGNLRKLLGRGR
jgi:hypothetical protein